MTNREEMTRWLLDAEDALKTTKANYKEGLIRTTVQNAQLCIEFSAKAIISCFEAPEWEHDPGKQLKRVLRKNEEIIGKKIGPDMIKRIDLLAQKASEVAVWHGWSTYGRREPNGSWLPGAKVCTKEIAEESMPPAELSFKTATDFCNEWFEE
jgi:HEPN domain-containing protein